MFEEVPRRRRGLVAYLGTGPLTARRIVLGPFVIGGGVLLAAVGGSVAVAATVFTASTIRASDVPPRPSHEPVAITTSGSAGRTASARPAPTSATRSSALAAPSAMPALSSSAGAAVQPPASSTLLARTPATTTAASPSPSGSASSSTTPSPTPTPSPAGNAVVFVSGWNADGKQLVFEFASVSKGTGPDHSDVYSIASPRQYTATLAADIRITSAGQLCPPAGSNCTVDQLIAGTARGFYAVLAVDPSAAVHQVLERDNADPTSPPTAPAPNPTPTSAVSAPAPSPRPSASPTSTP